MNFKKIENSDDLEHHLSHEHYSHKLGWLRAAVLGANDGIISVSSVLVGVIVSGATPETVLLVGFATLFGGIFAMAAGEYVSVASQDDTEKVDLEIEKERFELDWDGELKELSLLFQEDGVSKELADRVAEELMEHDALNAHTKYELGITDANSAQPLQAALASSLSFFAGGIFPVLIAYFFIDIEYIMYIVSTFSLFLLVILGGWSSYIGGANIFKGMIRVGIWGSLAMAVTLMVGLYFGAFH